AISTTTPRYVCLQCVHWTGKCRLCSSSCLCLKWTIEARCDYLPSPLPCRPLSNTHLSFSPCCEYRL
ncbi:unnamed protein product, partial [Pylaiella littoralis]